MEVDYESPTSSLRMDLCEKNWIPKNWGKIGDIYCDSQSQCSFICTICVGAYTDEFHHATFITSEFSEFWNHAQNEHLPKTKHCVEVDNSNDITETEEFTSNVVSNMDAHKHVLATPDIFQI